MHNNAFVDRNQYVRESNTSSSIYLSRIHKNVFIGLIACCSLTPYDQFPQTGIENFVSPNPNVSELFKYAESPVSYSSMPVSVSVPIYSLSSKNLSIKVSISYHSIVSSISDPSQIVFLIHSTQNSNYFF